MRLMLLNICLGALAAVPIAMVVVPLIRALQGPPPPDEHERGSA